MRSSAALLLVAAAVAASAFSSPAPPPRGRPLLVTVDDLPVSSARLHPDPGERERITRRLLDALRARGVRAVGLVTWRNVRDEEDRRLLDLWLEAGHELGNHSFAHPDLTRTPVAEWIADAERGREALAAHLSARGLALRFFRFPFLREGATEAERREARAWLARSGQRDLPVTLDTQDASFEEPWVEARRRDDRQEMARVAEDFQASLRLAVERQERVGDELFGRTTPQILLLHATEVGAEQWARLLDGLQESGHRFATADEVLADPAFADPPAFLASFGCGLWDRIAHAQDEERSRAEIEALLHRQAEAWSRGDVEAFASAYDDDVLFVSPSGMTRGRAEVIARYRERYPDRLAMGSLALEVLDVRTVWGRETSPLGDALPGRIHGATVVARWTISRPDRSTASGLTLLALERGPDGFRIVRDASM